MNSWNDFEEPHIDLTPLIDTVFLLLIFFIMATTFSKPVLDVVLAQANSASTKELPPQRLTISIDHAGEIYFEEQLVKPDDVEATLAPYPADTHIIFNIDQDAPFGEFVHVLDTAKSQKRSNFIINSARPETAQPQANGNKLSSGQSGGSQPAAKQLSAAKAAVTQG